MLEMASELPPIGQAVSGALGASISNTLVYPLDLVVTRFQTQRQVVTKPGDTVKKQEEPYESLIDAFRRIHSGEGVSGFYAGWSHDTVANVSSTFFYHYAYSFVRDRRLQSRRLRNGGAEVHTLGVVEELAVGAVAGIFSRFFTTPVSNIVTRKQTARQAQSTDQIPTTESIVKDIYREKGVTGFWSGYRSSIVLTANPAICYYLFEVFKDKCIPQGRRPTSLEIFFYSAIAKVIASTVTYPLILTKARMQASPSRNQSPVEFMRTVVQKHGWIGLYEGLLGQLVKGFFAQGFMMTFKDKSSQLIVMLWLLTRRILQRGVQQSIQSAVDSSSASLDSAVEQAKNSDTMKWANSTVAEATNGPIGSAVAQAAGEANDALNRSRDYIQQKASEISNSQAPIMSQVTGEANAAMNRGRELIQNKAPETLKPGIEWSGQKRNT